MGHVVYKLHWNSISVSVFTMFNNEQDPQEAALEEEEVLLVAMALMVRGRRQRRPPEVWHGCRMSFHFQGVSHGLTQSRDGLFRSYDKRMDFVFRRMGVV